MESGNQRLVNLDNDLKGLRGELAAAQARVKAVSNKPGSWHPSLIHPKPLAPSSCRNGMIPRCSTQLRHINRPATPVSGPYFPLNRPHFYVEPDGTIMAVSP